ncbi:MAG: PHP domain-containing protein, partial [Rhodospirillaceae bacterium]|nr:PHP domain-containing protein [Rhodospirillaceae bacterium]
MGSGMDSDMPYVELQTLTNFSFLEGASHPEELAIAAAALGMPALGVADRNSLAGVVRAHVAAKQAGIRLVVGARLDLADGPGVLVYPRDRAAYGRLSQVITTGRRRAEKGDCHLTRDDLAYLGADQVAVVLPPDAPDPQFAHDLADVRDRLGGPVYLAASARYDGRAVERLAALAMLARQAGTPLVATNDVIAHGPQRKP